MRLSPAARKVIEAMAEEYEKNPASRLEGIPKRVFGAYEVWELEDAGLVHKLGRDRIILTEEGHHYVRPPSRRRLDLLKGPAIAIKSTVVNTLVRVAILIGPLR